MNLPISDTISVSRLAGLFDKMSESYKIFWFQAIADQVHKGNYRISFNDLINHMVADAWYMVSEYKLNLGPSDNLEALIHYVYDLGHLKASEKKEKILEYLSETQNPEIIKKKNILTQNVPYRLQAPFLGKVDKKQWGSIAEIITVINENTKVIYKFEEAGTDRLGLKRMIYVTDEWRNYIQKNYPIIKAWIQYNMIIYLQKRNPSVPGISTKLYPPVARKLDKVQGYWKAVIKNSDVINIYTGEPIEDEKQISIDHFVPWSYVAHDELWNLVPTTKSINSSKGNGLPVWENYFERLFKTEYDAFQVSLYNDEVNAWFHKCKKEHVNSQEIKARLYREEITQTEFGNVLGEILEPVYKSAKNMGFGSWDPNMKHKMDL